jgi:hypothetical protein
VTKNRTNWANSITNHHPERRANTSDKTTNCNSIIINHNPNRLWVMVFNTTFTNISVKSWRAVLLVPPRVYGGVHILLNLLFSVYCFVYRCLFFCSFSFGHCVFCPSNYGLSPLTVWVRTPLRRGANSMTNHNPVRQTPMKQKTTNCNSIIMNHNPNRVSVVLSCLTPLSKYFSYNAVFLYVWLVLICVFGLRCGRRGPDRLVLGLMTTYEISAYYH